MELGGSVMGPPFFVSTRIVYQRQCKIKSPHDFEPRGDIEALAL